MSERKTVLVATFNNSKSNYGGVFQSCALSMFLEGLGHDPVYLTLEQRGTQLSKTSPKSIKRVCKEWAAKSLSLLTSRARRIRTEKFRCFTEKTQARVKYKDYNHVLQSPPAADVYLAGSDQVWNPRNINAELFLAFAPRGSRLISYAASMGNEQIPTEHRKFFHDCISRYSAISVREDTMIEVVQEHARVPVVQNIDPVFLLEPEQWLALAKPYQRIKFKKYILLYLVEWSPAHTERLKALRKKTGLPIVMITPGARKRWIADQEIFDASPEEFLSLLSGAEIVITSSFHGTALSILFNKPFFAVSGSDKPTRIESLLRLFSLEDHNTKDFTLESATVDYAPVNGIIAAERKRAEEYLLTAIMGEGSHE